MKKTIYCENKTYGCIIPKNLNIEFHLDRKPVQIKQHQRKPYIHRDRLLYILHQIGKRYSLTEGKSYSNICSEHLRGVFKNYKPYIEYLLTHKIIEKDEKWEQHKKCLGYRFTKRFRKGTKTTYIMTQEIIEKIEAVERERSERAKKEYPALCQWFKQLKCEEQSAERILRHLYKEDEETCEKQMQLVRRINSNDQNFLLGRTGRLYTPISNIKTEIRQTLRVEGKSLIELDIKSSIPFVTARILEKEGFEKENIKEKIEKYKFKYYPRKKGKEKRVEEALGGGIDSSTGKKQKKDKGGDPFTPLMWAKIPKFLKKIDVLRFINQVQSGDIYELLAAEFTERSDKNYTRSDAKILLLKILNSPVYLEHACKSILKELYPNVIRIIDTINGYFRISQKSQINDDVAPFAYITQEIESDFVLKTVCKRIELEHPQMPIFTIHDAFYTTDDYVDVLEQIILSESVKFFGKEVVIKRKYLFES